MLPDYSKIKLSVLQTASSSDQDHSPWRANTRGRLHDVSSCDVAAAHVL